MFTRCFSIACFIVSTYMFFVPNIAKAPLIYFPKVKTWEEIADQYSELYKLNPCIMRAVIKVESDGCNGKKSKAGAAGCTQLMPATARALGLKVDAGRDDREIPEDAIAVGTKHLAGLIHKQGLILGLKIYNAGPLRVDMTAENRAYANKVISEIARCIG